MTEEQMEELKRWILETIEESERRIKRDILDYFGGFSRDPIKKLERLDKLLIKTIDSLSGNGRCTYQDDYQEYYQDLSEAANTILRHLEDHDTRVFNVGFIAKVWGDSAHVFFRQALADGKLVFDVGEAPLDCGRNEILAFLKLLNDRDRRIALEDGVHPKVVVAFLTLAFPKVTIDRDYLLAVLCDRMEGLNVILEEWIDKEEPRDA